MVGQADLHKALFDFCNEEVLRAKTPYFLSYLNGPPEQPNARACFVGLASWQRLPEMVRAVYEDVAFESCGHIDHLLSGRKQPRAAASPPPWRHLT